MYDDCINEKWKSDKKLDTFFKRCLITFIYPDYCVNKYGFGCPWFRKNEILRPVLEAFCYYMLILLCISLIVVPVSAGQTLNSSLLVGNITDTTIEFNVFYKTDVRATGATFDGIEIIGFDTQHNITYVAKELQPDSTHEFCIYKDLINCEIAKTTNIGNSESKMMDFIYKYWLVFVSILFMLVGLRIPLIGIVAFIFALIGFLSALLIGEFWTMIIYVVVFITSMYISYYGVKH